MMGMGQYRNRLQIIADVLVVVKGGAKKTRIMYQANLSYRLLIQYLDYAIEAGLVSMSKDQDQYILTPKGSKFLKDYEQFSERQRELEEQLQTIERERSILEEAYATGAINSRSRNSTHRQTNDST